ncbi:MAG: IS200/IS605 family element transposase accessory protein TnpB [Methanomicrobia archaeon]|nr:IS200/IS605 family element transposase accessory protein TnpB [Methanomicrobia archaeon]
MDRKTEEARATIKGKLELEDLERAKVFYTMRLFKEAVEKAHHLIKKGLSKGEIVKSLYWTIPNTHYCEAAYAKAKLYSEQNHLKLKNPLLFSTGKGAGREEGNRNIKIKGNEVKIKIAHADGKHEWVTGKLIIQKRYLPILNELEDYGYSAGISLKDNRYRLHISVPVELYAKKDNVKRVKKEAKNIASFDLNSDRINMTLMRSNGLLIEARNKNFPEVNSPGYSENKAKDTRLKALSELIKYATAHDVKTFVFERLKMKGAKNISSKTGNRKMSKFAAREFLSHAEIMIRKRGGEFKQVNPAYSSKNARIINQDLGMDVHTASALVLGLRYLHTPKNI